MGPPAVATEAPFPLWNGAVLDGLLYGASAGSPVIIPLMVSRSGKATFPSYYKYLLGGGRYRPELLKAGIFSSGAKMARRAPGFSGGVVLV